MSAAEIMQGIKGASAHKINRLLSRTGQVWQRESFDRVLRLEESMHAKIEYIVQNPVRAGLVKIASDYPSLWVPDLADRQRPAGDTFLALPHERGARAYIQRVYIFAASSSLAA
ncbi:MAG: transposase [Terriglobales bacterium]